MRRSILGWGHHEKVVVLVGTSHAYQRAGGSCSPSEAIAFCQFVEFLCKKWKVRLVTEEMSLGALKEYDLVHSSVSQLAHINNIKHRYIDPDRSQRQYLGIIEDNDIRMQGQFEEWSDAEVDSRIGVEYRKREGLWLWSLLLLDRWPAIFVCGSNHVESFEKLLQDSQIIVHVEAINWTP